MFYLCIYFFASQSHIASPPFPLPLSISGDIPWLRSCCATTCYKAEARSLWGNRAVMFIHLAHSGSGGQVVSNPRLHQHNYFGLVECYNCIRCADPMGGRSQRAETEPHGNQRNIREPLTVIILVTALKIKNLIAILKNQAVCFTLGKTFLNSNTTKEGDTNKKNVFLPISLFPFYKYWINPSVQLHNAIIIQLAAVNPKLIPYGGMKGSWGYMHTESASFGTGNVQVNRSELPKQNLTVFSKITALQQSALVSQRNYIHSSSQNTEKLCDFKTSHSDLQAVKRSQGVKMRGCSKSIATVSMKTFYLCIWAKLLWILKCSASDVLETPEECIDLS